MEMNDGDEKLKGIDIKEIEGILFLNVTTYCCVWGALEPPKRTFAHKQKFVTSWGAQRSPNTLHMFLFSHI